MPIEPFSQLDNAPEVRKRLLPYCRLKTGDIWCDGVLFDMPDTCLHNCEIVQKQKPYYVNVKMHNMGSKENKNDIAAVEKLYMQYSANPNYNLIYACFGIRYCKKAHRVSFCPNNEKHDEYNL